MQLPAPPAKERDSETLNDDFGARYYSWRYARWLSADWSSVPAPVPYANLNNPQTLNLYAMVSDNPTTRQDQDGHCFAALVDSIVCGIVAGILSKVGSDILRSTQGRLFRGRLTSGVQLPAQQPLA